MGATQSSERKFRIRLRRRTRQQQQQDEPQYDDHHFNHNDVPNSAPTAEDTIFELQHLCLRALPTDGNDSCPICSECYNTGDSVVLFPCRAKHMYHSRCMMEWLSRSPTCPVCRADVNDQSNVCCMDRCSPCKQDNEDMLPRTFFRMYALMKRLDEKSEGETDDDDGSSEMTEEECEEYARMIMTR